MGTVDKSALLAPRTGNTGELEIEGIGTLTIRALTRSEALRLNDVGSLEEKDNLLISMGVVEPALTPADVAAWASVAPAGEVSAVSEAIAVISGMTKTSAKEVTKSAAGRRRRRQ